MKWNIAMETVKLIHVTAVTNSINAHAYTSRKTNTMKPVPKMICFEICTGFLVVKRWAEVFVGQKPSIGNDFFINVTHPTLELSSRKYVGLA